MPMYVQVSCPYCKTKSTFKVELEKKGGSPVKGPYEQHCPTCDSRVDLLRMALLTFKTQSQGTAPTS